MVVFVLTGGTMAENQGKSILLVDDNRALSDVLRADWEVAGYRVVTAQDGEEGLSEAKRVRPDLIVLDIGIPKLSGYEVARKLREDPDFESIPIIFQWRESTRRRDEEELLGNGPLIFVAKKTASLPELRALIAAALRQHGPDA